MPYLANFLKSSSKNSIIEGFQAILLGKVKAIVRGFWLENRSNRTWYACIQLQKYFKMFEEPSRILKRVFNNALMPYLAIF